MECSCTERRGGGGGGDTLAVLREVQRAYEDRMDALARPPASPAPASPASPARLQMQVDLLRSWVGDLVGQNTLLAQAVEALEGEAITRLLMEQRKHKEMVCELRAELAGARRRLARKDADLRGLVEVLRRLRDLDCCDLADIHFFEVTESDIFGEVPCSRQQKKMAQGDSPSNLKHTSTKIKSYRHRRPREKRCMGGTMNEMEMLNESLHKENISKDREIRKLQEDAQQYEQTIMSLRNELSNSKDVSRKGGEVMACVSCTGAEVYFQHSFRGDWEQPVKDFNSTLREEMLTYQESIQKMENNLKARGADVRALRRENVGLRGELHALRGVCAALHEHCRAAEVRARFKDDIIREMRRQLRHAKAKTKEVAEMMSVKSRETQELESEILFSFPPRCNKDFHLENENDFQTSTPNSSRERTFVDCRQSPDASIIEYTTPVQAPVLIVHDSNEDFDGIIAQCTINCSTEFEEESDSSNGFRSLRDRTSTDKSSRRCESKRVRLQALEQDQLNKTYTLRHDQDLTQAQLDKPSELSRNHQEAVCDITCESRCKHVRIETPERSEVLEEPLDDNSAGNLPSVMHQVDKSVRTSEESRSSAAESPSGSCASARAHYFQNKLLATMQILQNKEETVRVQAQSLAVAEARIATLTSRGAELKREIERKGREIQTLRKALEECRIEKTDASVTAQLQEMDNQENIMTTLQNNLGVIEELYRECFYETVKQENLIEMLRKSYLDVRLIEKDKSDRISKLHNVINTQKWSLDKCQDIASEVDSLKMEISNFINSSNNDSGMWEESIVGGLNEDLQDIEAQLLRLRDLLTGDCTCGLEEENVKLRQNSKALEAENSDLRSRITDLEANLLNKNILDKQLQEHIENKDKELNCIREQLRSLEQNTKDQSSRCDMLSRQLSQTQVLLEDKSSELSKMQKQCEIYEKTIKAMKEELNESEQINKETACVRQELCGARRRCARLQRRAALLEGELSRADLRSRRLEACYRDTASSAAELERQLEQSAARGGHVCREAGRVVRAVRAWAAGVRAQLRDQEEQLKQKESELRLLQQRLEPSQNMASRICPNKRDQCCSARPSASALTIGQNQQYDRTNSNCEATCSKYLPRNEGTFDSADQQEKWDNEVGTSASEIASCSSTPVPPKRTAKKTTVLPFGIKPRYGWLGPFVAVQRDAAAQHPGAAAAALSPGEEMLSRMESLSAALADGYRRWSRRAT